MYRSWKTLAFLAFVTLLPCFSTKDLRTEPEKQQQDTNTTFLAAAALSLKDESNMEHALSVLNNLTTAQNQVWEQQQEHERRIWTQNREEEEREKARSMALQQEQITLREIRGQISRKLKAMARSNNGHSSNGQGGIAGGVPPKDCGAIYLEGEETSGVYRVWPTWDKDGKGLLVYCDMDNDGGGWTVIHRWVVSGHPNDYFVRNWNDYVNGFGDLASSFWLGNEAIHKLTKQGAYELRFDFLKGDEKTFTKYGNFMTEGVTANYKLHISGFDDQGTGGDVFSNHDGNVFSTSDMNHLPKIQVLNPHRYSYRDSEYISQDPKDCANIVGRGWWFNSSCDLHPELKSLYQPGVDQPQNDTTVEMSIRATLFLEEKIS